MRKIGAIAAMTQNRVIGLNNCIPWHYSEDFKRFKRVTLNSAIIMGRKTWESIGSKALPKRRNIVISRSEVKGIEHYPSIEQALRACSEENNIWLIGGGQIYAQGLAFCNHLDITLVPDKIDTDKAILFPQIDPAHWDADLLQVLAEDPRLQTRTYTRRH